MKKNNIVKLFAVMACATSLLGAGVMKAQAAEVPTLFNGVDVSSFRMDYGASVRFKATDNQIGIRFTASMEESVYDGLEALQTETVQVNYGMIIVPADMAEIVENPYLAFGDNYTLTDCNEDSDECVCGKTHIASVSYERLYPKNGEATIRGSLVNIKTQNVTRAFVGIGYIEYNNDGACTYQVAKWALNEAEEAGSENVDNNMRSMTHVSQLAIEAKQDDGDNTLYNNYVKTIAESGKQYKYTVKHYLPIGENGAYVNVENETKYAALNSSVTATNIAKSGLANKSEYKDYATYSFDTEKGDITSLVYPNGRTVLNCYYKEVDTVLWDASNAEDVAILASNTTKPLTKLEADTVMQKGTYYYQSGVEYLGRQDVLKYVVNQDTYQWGIGQFWLSFVNTAERPNLNKISDINWDYLKVKMCAVPTVSATGAIAKTSLTMYNGSVKLGDIPTNEWVDFIIPKAALNSKTSSPFGNGAPKNKVDVDWRFKNRTFCANPSDVLFYSNSLKSTDGKYSLTYYFDEISYGIDCETPEVVGISQAVSGQAYTPAVTVKDNLLGDLKVVGATSPAGYTVKVFEVDITSGARTEIIANNGAYTLPETAGKKYVLGVSVTDSSYPDYSDLGNVDYKEFDITIKKATDIVVVNNKFDIGAVKAVTWALDSVGDSITPVISFADSYTANGVTENNVIKYETRNLKNNSYGAGFYMNLDTTSAGAIADTYFAALADDTQSFKLKFRMCMIVDGTTNKTATLIGKDYFSDAFNLGEWVDLEITEEQLSSANSGWATKQDIINRLTGANTNYLFYFNWRTFSGTAEQKVTIYLKSISYEI